MVKAYRNEAFLDSRDARPLRIMAEYLEPEARFDRLRVRDTIIFFGSARIPSKEAASAELEAAQRGEADIETAEMRFRMSRYYEDARELAHRLTSWSKSLEGTDRRFVICTGGGPGIMEAASRGASEAKGLNIGLTISIPVQDFVNPYVTRQLAFEFHYFFMRKFWFAYLAKAAVAMPGGFGTLDELFEVLTLIQTLKMRKRLPIVLFGTEFWRQVIDFEALAKFGVIDREDLDLFFQTNSVNQAFEFITRELTEHTLGSPGATL
ncbi:MAG: LOG family protein [Kiloniellales bacterium]